MGVGERNRGGERYTRKENKEGERNEKRPAFGKIQPSGFLDIRPDAMVGIRILVTRVGRSGAPFQAEQAHFRQEKMMCTGPAEGLGKVPKQLLSDQLTPTMKNPFKLSFKMTYFFTL